MVCRLPTLKNCNKCVLPPEAGSDRPGEAGLSLGLGIRTVTILYIIAEKQGDGRKAAVPFLSKNPASAGFFDTLIQLSRTPIINS